MDRLGQLLASLGCSWDGLDLVAVFSRRNPDRATENLFDMALVDETGTGAGFEHAALGIA